MWNQSRPTVAIYTSLVIDTEAINAGVLQPTGQADQLLSLQISPNPATNLMNFHLNHRSEQYCSLVITDVMGRVVSTIYEGRLNNSEEDFSFHANRLPNGIYYCITKSGDERVVQKFIIAH
jgi:hypothetical protein